MDILTKPLGKVKFLTFRERLGIVEQPYDVGPVGRGARGALGALRTASRSYEQPQG